MEYIQTWAESLHDEMQRRLCQSGQLSVRSRGGAGNKLSRLVSKKGRRHSGLLREQAKHRL